MRNENNLYHVEASVCFPHCPFSMSFQDRRPLLAIDVKTDEGSLTDNLNRSAEQESMGPLKLVMKNFGLQGQRWRSLGNAPIPEYSKLREVEDALERRFEMPEEAREIRDIVAGANSFFTPVSDFKEWGDQHLPTLLTLSRDQIENVEELYSEVAMLTDPSACEELLSKIILQMVRSTAAE